MKYTNDKTHYFSTRMLQKIIIVFIIMHTTTSVIIAQKNSKATTEHPCLIMQKKDVAALKQAIQTHEIIRKSYTEELERANNAVRNPIDVPIPVDPAGAYTHERHRHNYLDMFAAGIAYQISGDTIYANFIRNMLLKYAAMYPNIGLHPVGKSGSPGKLFWQSLNESVWLVYAIQAYDCVYDAISPQDRKQIEKNVFREMVKFITVDCRPTFDKIHNHGTWAAASVGLTGYVLGDKEMVKMAILGTKGTKETGFLRQIDDLFSPDGYYAEGPYYLRYALKPFLMFAQCIENNQPDLRIFEYKNQVFRRAILAELQFTDEKGQILPLNDALRDKSIQTDEIVTACDIAYHQYRDTSILPIIQQQGRVIIGGISISAAQGIAAHAGTKFQQQSLFVRDGIDGKNGGVAISRIPFKGSKLTTLLKFSTQGMDHGHFDRLSMMAYDANGAFLTDYGSARFLNVPTKNGGRYLPENKSWATQTIAHNTVTADQTSHCKADWRESEKCSPALLYNNFDADLHIMAATDSSAYPGIRMKRIMAVVPQGDHSFIIDLFSLESAQAHSYDYAFHYDGQIVATTFGYKAIPSEQKQMGENFGYQHLSVEAIGNTTKPYATLTWMRDTQFYSISTVADAATQFFLANSNANDPEYNIRHEPAYIIRQPAAKNHTFVSIIEPHGSFNADTELVTDPVSCLTKLQLSYSDSQIAIVDCAFVNGTQYRLCISLQNDPNKQHNATIGTAQISWKGNYKLITQ